jgi:hypothetical protein
VWEAAIDGRPLRFQLAGINNQNFIMRDEETGSWWQQVTGEAILGPFKGRRLKPVLHDEVSVAIWKREKPNGRILRPDDRIAASGGYAPWEEHVSRLPVVTPVGSDSSLEARAVVVGVAINGESRAYPFSTLKERRIIIDSVGRVPILILLGDDQKSVRGFNRRVDDCELEFFLKTESKSFELIDSETGSEWDFTGKALRGPLTGQQLEKVFVLKDFWFDWKTYNTDTTVFK